MARIKATNKAGRGERASMNAPDKLLILFTIVNREKTDFFVDVLQNFEINLQMVLAAQGTASDSIISLLGLDSTDKSVIISIVRKDRSKEALAMLEEKFKTVKGGKGIAYTVPMSSTIGVAIYQFISNKNSGGIR